jgi:PAS domain S-box-containing protein
MEVLAQLVATHEDWLVTHVLQYARERSYVKHAPALAEALRVSVADVSAVFLAALDACDGMPELGPDDDYAQDPIASFGIVEAQRHRGRGVTLAMFLGLMKYYRQSYADLVLQAGFGEKERERSRLFIDRFFDRVELGFCTEWSVLVENEKTEELQATNRRITDEQKQAEAMLEYRSEFARLVSDIAMRLVGPMPGHADQAIEEALERIGRFAQADAAHIFRFSDDHRTFSLTHLWQSGRLSLVKEDLLDVEAAAMPWWMMRIREGGVLAVSSVDKLPDEADAERQLLRSQGIHSLAVVPLSRQEEVLGFMGLSAAEERRVWSGDEIHLLRILGQVLTNALQREQAEEALARERNLLRTLIDLLPDYIFAKDTNSRFILNNVAHVRLLRASGADEILGKTDYDIFPEDLAARYFTDEQSVIHSGEPLVNREESVIDEKGSQHWLLTTKVPLRDDDGKTVGIVGMSRNITQRKRMAQELAEHAALLEQANADLERRNQELDEFTYVASHDLQEPLRKLIAFSGVLREDMAGGDEEEIAKDLEVIAGAAGRMRQLVQDLLALSRSGRQEMKWEEVALDHCVERALDALELRVLETKATIRREPLPVVKGDPSLLTQLYQNLIGNALKFHGEGPPVVRLAGERAAEHWLISVSDDGIGIKTEYAEQIFSPFKRLHRRDEYEGTGIGLAICRKIVERHRGRIWVESEPGSGAHFKFTIDEPQGEKPS